MTDRDGSTYEGDGVRADGSISEFFNSICAQRPLAVRAGSLNFSCHGERLSRAASVLQGVSVALRSAAGGSMHPADAMPLMTDVKPATQPPADG